ncbi:MAG: 50S ribosomal protein L3 [Bdellovibrionales bacterium]|nr:50S ribosomal protein L3 [Bdellovibrionales bacterium]
MALGLLGKKLGMTQYNSQRGRMAATLIETGPCLVMQKKTLDKDGYTAVKLAFGEKKEKHSSKAMKKSFEKVGATPKRFIKEFRVSPEELDKFEEGQSISLADVFTEGQWIDVAGTSKGRGFSGVMKRWNFKGFIRTHGTHEFFRHGGSIGQCATPGHVDKGKKMPGHLGDARVKTLKLQILKVLPEQNTIVVSGSVPGAKQGLVEITPSARKKASFAA